MEVNEQNISSSDLISRQDALYAVKAGALSAATIFGRTDEGMVALSETVRIIKDLPSAQPQQWIPVTERLPDEDGTYIVTGKKGAVYSISYRDDGHWWYGGNKPLAWMPLPEAWEGWKE